MKPRGPLLALGALVLCFGGIGSLPLFEPDEGRYAEIPREMLASRDFVTPRLNGVLYFEKPPLYYWLCAASLALVRGVERGARFCSALSCAANVALAYALARALRGARAGRLAALFLATSPLHFALAHVNLIDPTLTLFLDATLVCFFLAQREERPRRALLLWHGMFAAAALATLTKGLIGIVIPGAVAGLYLLLAGRLALLRRVPWISGVLLFAALAVPWHVLVALRNPDFLWFYFVHEHLLRYATAAAAREHPFWYFVAVLVPGLAPWWGLLPAALPRRPFFRTLRLRDERLFLLGWAGFVVLFFSASRSKLVPYVLPALLPLAVLLALALDEAQEREELDRIRRGMLFSSVLLAAVAGALLWLSVRRFGWGGMPVPTLLAGLAAAAALASAVPWTRGDVRRALAGSAVSCALLFGCLLAGAGPANRERTARGLATYLRPLLRPGDEVVCYRDYPQSLPVYLGRTVSVVAYLGELEFGVSKLGREERSVRFPTPAQLRELWESGATVYLVTEEKDLATLAQDGVHPGPNLFREGRRLLFKNH